MSEVWLRPNRRIAYFGAIPLTCLALSGISVAAGLIGSPASPLLPRVAGGLVTAAAAGCLAIWLSTTQQPRLAYRDGFVLVGLRPRRPVRVPIDLVECFFLGHGPSLLPGRKATAETTNVVMRLAERAEPYRRVDVHAILGSWCDGYATIRGTWCEPLDVEIVNRLNHRLKEAKRRCQNAGGVGT